MEEVGFLLHPEERRRGIPSKEHKVRQLECKHTQGVAEEHGAPRYSRDLGGVMSHPQERRQVARRGRHSCWELVHRGKDITPWTEGRVFFLPFLSSKLGHGENNRVVQEY